MKNRKKVDHWKIVLVYEDGSEEVFDGDQLTDSTSSDIDQAIVEAGHKVTWR